MPSMIQAASILGALAVSVQAHGHLSDIHVDGQDFTAYDPSFQFQNPAPEVIEWSCKECLDNGFVDPTMYDDVTKIACHKDATAGAKVAKVKAGGIVTIQWNTWPDSHLGPILDYLAKVEDATTAKAGDLEFFKIDAAGFENDQWASSKLIANNLTWSVTIPKNIASGQYVLRHEIIALHSAGQENGAQNYPKCINLEVEGSGTETPAGVTADKFYKATDPGIKVNIYGDNSKYQIPGPALFDGASSGSGSSSGGSPAAAPAASSPAASSPAASSPAASSPAASSPAASSPAASSPAASSPAAASAAASAPAASSPAASSPADSTPSATSAPAATSSAAAQNNAVSSPDASPSATSAPDASAPAQSGSDSIADKEFTVDTFIAWLEEKAGISSGPKVRRHPRAFRV